MSFTQPNLPQIIREVEELIEKMKGILDVKPGMNAALELSMANGQLPIVNG